MSQTGETTEKGAQSGIPEEDTTTVRAFWADSTEIRELKRRLKLHSQQEVLRHLLRFFREHSGKEEKVDGVHSS